MAGDDRPVQMPTVGRKVYYWPTKAEIETFGLAPLAPLFAEVAAMGDGKLISLLVFIPGRGALYPIDALPGVMKSTLGRLPIYEPGAWTWPPRVG